MKRLTLISLSLFVLLAGFLLEAIPGFAQSVPRTRNNLDSGLQYQQEGSGEQYIPKASTSTTQTKNKNNVRRNSISKGGTKKQ